MLYQRSLTGQLCALAFFLLLLGSCGETTEPTPRPSPSPPSTPTNTRTDFTGEIRDISSADLVAEMGIGWNLGNSFDVTSKDKTAWGNPLPTASHISLVKQMGFKTLRIPVTWGFNQNSFEPFPIDRAYLDKVQEVVNHGLRNQMHVIINVHHDDDWIRPTLEDAEEVKMRLASLWTQVAERFETYGDSLIFETLNEPRLKGASFEWSGGDKDGRDVLNQYHEASVDAIRATGGNNARRHIMISTYAASTVAAAMDELVIPNDDPNVIISLHTYFPWSFAGQQDGPSDWGSEDEKAALSHEFDRIRDKWLVQENRPVILGEWGTTNKDNLSERVDYARYYVSESSQRGLLTIVWDDGGNFGLLDRHNLNWRFPQIAETIIEAAQ